MLLLAHWRAEAVPHVPSTSTGRVRAGAGLLKTGDRPVSGCLYSSVDLGPEVELLMGGKPSSDDRVKRSLQNDTCKADVITVE